MIDSLPPEAQAVLELVSSEFKPESVASAHAALVAEDLDDLLVPAIAAAAVSFKMHRGVNWRERAVSGIASNLSFSEENAEKLVTIAEAIARLEPK